ncbi:hypothetical protein D3C76_1444220 [compost metagenome]|jgi:hypothetical protein
MLLVVVLEGNCQDTSDSFNANSYFRGSPSFFGGVTYQTPWDPWSLKLEYEGYDYQHEPQNNNQVQDSPINLDLVFKANDTVDLHWLDDGHRRDQGRIWRG